MSNLSLIIPTYRNPQYLDLVLRSATELRGDINNSIIVILDGYVNESIDVINKYKNIQCIELSENKGMAAALNIGVSQCETEYIFVINDDQVLPQNWDNRILNLFTTNGWDTDKIVITANQVEPTGPGMYNFPVIDLGKTPETFQYDKWLELEPTLSKHELVKGGEIFPYAMAKKYYMAIGGFDVETFQLAAQVVDYDFFLKLEIMGFEFYRDYSINVYHFGSISTKHGIDSEKFKRKELEAHDIYNWKWGASLYNHPGTNSKIPPDKQFRGFKV